ncbi:MAG: hypothetical protein HYW50_01785 [Candidatus Diapherotrites archaeon]|nr:hypothetical protein [Candidatus Diapherotrites archaeon]
MRSEVVKQIFARNGCSIGDLAKEKIASIYTIYRTIEELEWLGVVFFEKGTIKILETPVTAVIKKLISDDFDLKIISKKSIEFYLQLLEAKTPQELAQEIEKSEAHTNALIKKYSHFLQKNGSKYSVSSLNPAFLDLLKLVAAAKNADQYWSGKHGEKLLKLSQGFPFDGTLTAFSRFNEFGLMIFTPNQYVFQPKKELSIEEILVHAIRFSKQASDIVLCIFFYLQNKHRANVAEIEKNCEKFGVLNLWFDIVSYLEDQPVKEKKMFLPKAEFLEKAAVYEIKTKPRFGESAITQIFISAEKKLKEKAKAFLIGGNALIEYGAKNSTKDIDIVLLSAKEAQSLIEALKAIGFVELKGKELQYDQLEAFTMLVKEDHPRIDIFVNKICGMLEFSERMQKRSRQTKSGKLELYLASLEDIFLLKSVSSRDSDLVDCENIMSKKSLEWNIIFSEITKQEKNLEGMKELIILEHIEALENRLGTKIPAAKKIANKGILFLAKKPVSIAQIKEKIKFPETTIRNKIIRLVKAKKITKTKDKPFKIVLTDAKSSPKKSP